MTEVQQTATVRGDDTTTADDGLQVAQDERRHGESLRQNPEGGETSAAADDLDGVWTWDIAANTINYSPRWKQMLGFRDDEIGTSPDEWFSRMHPEDVVRTRQAMDEYLKGQIAQFNSEHRMQSKSGVYKWMLCHAVAQRNPAGALTKVTASQTDITAYKLIQEKLGGDVLHDRMTGLANRVMLMIEMNRRILNAPNVPDSAIAALFLNVDRFKLINNSLGHAAGDQLLREISKRLLAVVRKPGKLGQGPQDVVARAGGDEFVLLLDTIRAPEDAATVAGRVLKAIGEPIQLDDHHVTISASIGIALSSDDCQRSDDILRNADTALYYAKLEGKERARVFDGQMHDAVTKRLWMESDLRHAVERNELTLYFQPIPSVETGKIAELESLVRWVHPTRGLIPPGEFIPLAEETGLIVQIGKWVLEAACRQLREWEATNPELADVMLAVNVSGKQLVRTEFVSEVTEILERSGLSPDRVKLEITESAMIDSGAKAVATLVALRSAGFQLHMDDFGSGYSSLSYLHRLPFTWLKMDRSFVQAMDVDQTAKPIVKAVVTLAHALGLKVVAEGVENAEHLSYLRGVGCDFLQGYYFSPPLPAAEATKYLTEALSGIDMGPVTLNAGQEPMMTACAA